MNSGIDKAIAPVLATYYSLAIAFVVIAVISAIIAKTWGGKTKQQRKATFSMVAGICFLVYVIFILPKFLGSQG